MATHLTIHQFSRLSGIPANLLRHYDSQEILQPDLRDETTGYRYYRPGQVARANRIKLLRDAGIGLEDIRELQTMEGRRKTRKTREYIREQEQILEKRHQNILLSIHYLRSLRIEAAGRFNPVRLIEMPALRAALKAYSGLHAEVIPAMRQLREELLSAGVTIAGDPLLAWQPERSSRDSTKSSTIAIPILGKRFDLPDVVDGTISGGTLAGIECRGDTARLGDSYEKLFAWCYEAGFVVSGPMRESYQIEEWIHDPDFHEATQNPSGKKRDFARRHPRKKPAVVSVFAPVQVVTRNVT